MSLPSALAGLLLPACAADGASGVGPASPLDFERLERPRSPNSALAAPAEYRPPPDTAAPVYPVPAARLYEALRAVAAQFPRTYLQAAYDEQLQAQYVVRSRVFNFPDLLAFRVLPRGEATSTLVLYTRSLYGYSDLGVNRKRVASWLAALERSISRSAP